MVLIETEWSECCNSGIRAPMRVQLSSGVCTMPEFLERLGGVCGDSAAVAGTTYGHGARQTRARFPRFLYLFDSYPSGR
jgi:hypothetical protein